MDRPPELGLSVLDRSVAWPYRGGERGRFYYQRDAHPTGVELERRLGDLDGGSAVVFPSGTAAAFALATLTVFPGGRIALAEQSYFGTQLLFRRLAAWG